MKLHWLMIVLWRNHKHDSSLPLFSRSYLQSWRCLGPLPEAHRQERQTRQLLGPLKEIWQERPLMAAHIATSKIKTLNIPWRHSAPLLPQNQYFWFDDWPFDKGNLQFDSVEVVQILIKILIVLFVILFMFESLMWTLEIKKRFSTFFAIH